VSIAMTEFTGNAEVKNFLKEWIKIAEEGRLTWAGVVGVAPGDQVGYGYAGMHPGELALRGIKILEEQVTHRWEEKITGDPKEGLDASYHEYNLAIDPINYDFLVWLIDAEMIRRREGAAWPLRVGFSHEDELTEKGRRFWAAVHKPLMPLLGAVEDPDAIGGRKSAGFTPTNICIAAKRGEEVPLLHANREARSHVRAWLWGKPKPITITLREGSHWKARNSNVEAWTKFARDLQRRGEHVVFVRDTEKANDPLEDFITYPSASFSIQPRMALYEEAKCNLFVSNGPGGLGIWSDRPYLYFIEAKRDEHYEPSNPEWWVRANGIGPGEQWPWATPSQKMIWKKDDYSNLCEAWEEHGGSLSN
jgi:hypothetical protein